MTDSTLKKTEEFHSDKKNLGLAVPFLATTAILIALTALYMNWRLTHTLNQQTQTFEATLNMLTQQQSSTEARLQAHRAITLSHEEREKIARKTFEEKIQSTVSESHHLADDWQLLKARHLLELAEINAHWGNDKATTIAMLQDADAVLAPLHNPALTSVREALAKDIHTTKSAPITDVTGLLTQLSAAEEATWTLTLNPLPKEPSKKPSEKNDPLNRISNLLQHVVIIQHHNHFFEPKPTLAFESMLRATVRLSLKEAEWAVLESNNTVYQLALTQAVQYLQQSFISNSIQTTALIDRLNQLKQVKLETKTAIPDQALIKLNQIIATNRNQALGETS